MVKKVVMLWGAPAAGKTAIARAVVQRVACTGQLLPHLSSDAIRETMAVTDYLAALRPVVYDGMQAMVSSALGAELPVLLDANYLDHARRAEVRSVAARHEVPLLSVLVRCAVDSRLARNRGRLEGKRVPDAYIRDAHERAEASRDEADLVVDTDVTAADQAAAWIADWLSAG